MSTDSADEQVGKVKPKFRGPVMFRRERKPGVRTADRNLLDTRQDSDWVHTDPWRVLRIQAEFVEGFGALAEIPPAVTVFGSARTGPDHPEYVAGREIGAALSRAGFAVITGGGPGAMEAANRGCSEGAATRSGSGSSCRSSRGSTSGWIWGSTSGTSSSARRCS